MDLEPGRSSYRSMNHPDVREAAAIGRPDPKWQERAGDLCRAAILDAAELPREARARIPRSILLASFR